MGLDTIGLIMEAEEIFGIKILDSQAASVVSVADFISLVQKEVGSSPISRPCMSLEAFHHIRIAIVKSTGTPRSRIKLTTSIKSIFPPPGRNQNWVRFQRLLSPLKLDHPSKSLLMWMPGTVSDLVKIELIRQARVRTNHHDWSDQEVRQIVRVLVSDYSGERRFRDHAELIQDLGLD